MKFILDLIIARETKLQENALKEDQSAGWYLVTNGKPTSGPYATISQALANQGQSDDPDQKPAAKYGTVDENNNFKSMPAPDNQ